MNSMDPLTAVSHLVAHHPLSEPSSGQWMCIVNHSSTRVNLKVRWHTYILTQPMATLCAHVHVHKTTFYHTVPDKWVGSHKPRPSLHPPTCPCQPVKFWCFVSGNIALSGPHCMYQRIMPTSQIKRIHTCQWYLSSSPARGVPLDTKIHLMSNVSHFPNELHALLPITLCTEKTTLPVKKIPVITAFRYTYIYHHSPLASSTPSPCVKIISSEITQLSF